MDIMVLQQTLIVVQIEEPSELVEQQLVNLHTQLLEPTYVVDERLHDLQLVIIVGHVMGLIDDLLKIVLLIRV